METLNNFPKPTLTAEEEPQSSEIAEYWRIVVRHLHTVGMIVLVSFLSSTLYFSILPNLYTSVVQILVEKVEPPKSYREDIIVPSFRGEEDYYGTQIAILTGRKVTQRAESELGYSLEKIKIDARRQRGTRIILLTVKHRDPKKSAEIANKIAEVYVAESLEENLFMSKQILKYIPDEAAPVPTPVAEGSAAETTPKEPVSTQTEVPSGFSKKEFAQSLSSVSSDPVAMRLRDEKIELESKINELSQRYRPQHPMIRQLYERLNYVNAQMEQRTSRIVTNLKANLGGQIGVTNVRILEEASIAEKPSEPKRLRGIFMNTVFGAFLAVAFVVLIENINQMVRTEDDLRRCARIPFLGYIPAVNELQKNKKKGEHEAPKSFFNFYIVDELEKNVVLADAVANVRTHILFSMPYEKSKRIMLTSALPNEGKTTVSALLSLSLSSLKRKILLIDADLRRPFLHTYFGLRNEKGLTDLLIGAAKPEEIVRSVKGSNLKIVTGGTMSSNPSELLSSTTFKDFLDRMTAEYDRLIIDVPPVLYIPDGLIVAKYVHSGVLVCGSGMVHKKIVKTVKEKFDAIGHSFIGAIINRADYEAEGYKYKYYRYYKSYYVGQAGRGAAQ